jgi:phenylacetate-CoA ligase
MVIVKGVNFYPRQVEQVLLRQPGFGPEYQILLERAPDGGDRLAICVEVEPGVDPAADDRVRRELGDRVGINPEIRRLPPGAIPRPPGKAVRVVDHRER